MATKSSTKSTSKSRSKTTFTSVTSGRLYIKASFNNTLVTFTNDRGDVVTWANTGSVGFKGARKSTPFAATTTIEEAVKRAKEKGMTTLDVFIKGPGPGRDAVLRVLRNAGFSINQVADITPVPHNGCRPKKPRRV